MRALFAIFFVVAFVVGGIYTVYAVSTAGLTNTSQCGENGGFIVAENECRTLFGSVYYD